MRDFWATDWCELRPRCCIAAAILGGSALGAGAQIFGANKAASAQTKASQQATQAQMSMFEQIKNALEPFINAGAGGINNLSNFINPNDTSSPLNALMRLTTPGPDQTAALEQTPGYQFTQGQGLKAVNNALAARGLGGSGGAVAKGAANFTTGLAQNTWQNVVNALQNVFSSGSGALQNFVNTGAQAGGALAGNATTIGGQIGSNLIGAGNAQAGAATATGNAVAGLGNNIGLAALIQKLTGGGAGGGGSGLYNYGNNSGDYNPNVSGGIA